MVIEYGLAALTNRDRFRLFFWSRCNVEVGRFLIGVDCTDERLKSLPAVDILLSQSSNRLVRRAS